MMQPGDLVTAKNPHHLRVVLRRDVSPFAEVVGFVPNDTLMMVIEVHPSDQTVKVLTAKFPVGWVQVYAIAT